MALLYSGRPLTSDLLPDSLPPFVIEKDKKKTKRIKKYIYQKAVNINNIKIYV